MLLSALAQAAPRIDHIGHPPGFSFVLITQAQDISAAGDVVAGYSFSIDDTRAHKMIMRQIAFRWTPREGMRPLPYLPGGYLAAAQAVSADGHVLVGFSNGKTAEGHTFQSHATRWSASDGVRDLGTLPGGKMSAASGVAANGDSIAGYGNNRQGRQRALLWRHNMPPEDLGTLGGLKSTALDISRDGRYVVGAAHDAMGRSRAFIWDAVGGMRDIGSLPGMPAAQAIAISDQGDVVVGHCAHAIDNWAMDSSAEKRGFIWYRASGRMQELVNTIGGVMTQPLGVADNGQSVVGVATDAHDVAHAFRWTPTQGMTIETALAEPRRMEFARSVSSDGRYSVGRLAQDDSAFRAEWR
jgi:probable HAF family extracellular repeat protein